jgi:hypothetical protein
MASRLPENICWRQGKTSLIMQFEDALLQRERETIHTLLHDPCIVEKRYVSADWLRREQSGAGWQFDGYPLWLALTIELWLQNQL